MWASLEGYNQKVVLVMTLSRHRKVPSQSAGISLKFIGKGTLVMY